MTTKQAVYKGNSGTTFRVISRTNNTYLTLMNNRRRIRLDQEELDRLTFVGYFPFESKR